MHYYSIEVVFQEVPGEISICFTICGCPLRCEGCHSPFLWKNGSGRMLSRELFIATLCRYSPMATCVLFMGGEWHEDDLVSYLKLAREMNYKTCLYTGEDTISDEIMNELTWVKTGKWIPALGGLNCRTTNQNFIKVSTNENYNHLFIN